MNVRAIARGAAILGVLFLGFDMLLSLLSTCDEISHYPSHKQDAAKYCTTLSGPLIGDIWRSFVWLGNALGEYDKQIVAAFTVILTISTSALWWSTRKLWIAGDNQLKLSRDEFNATHRPQIRLKHLWLTTDIWEGESVHATAVFVNTGMAPAILLELNFGTYIIKSGRMLPTDPNWIKKCTASLATHAPLGAGISLEIKGLNDGRVLKDADNVALRENVKLLYFAGAIEYRDSQRAIRKTAFCRVLKLDENANAGQRGRFLPVEDKDYEYQD